MDKSPHTAKQFMRNLREAEVEFGRVQRPPQVWRNLGITEKTHYRGGRNGTRLQSPGQRLP